jgi:hypothetical protein
MKHRCPALAFPALCLFAGASCHLDTVPAATEAAAARRPGTSDADLDGIILPAPMRVSSTRTGIASGAGADDGSAARGGMSGDRVDAGRGGSSSANAANGGSQPPPIAGVSGGTAGDANANTSGSGGAAIAVSSAGSGAAAGHGGVGSAAGSSAAGHSAGRGGAGMPEPAAGRGGSGPRGQAGRPAPDGDDTTATFNQLIDKLSNALTEEQRARIVQALTTNTVTPEQLDELLDAVTREGACDGAHDTCQQMCGLVLSACPTCNRDRMTASAEQAKCAAL